MGVRNLIEETRDLVIDHIKANIAIALNDKRTQMTGDVPAVTTEPPRQYFIYPKAKGFLPPSVFVICNEFDFRVAQKGANHINAQANVTIAILVEDRDMERLTTKADRYFDAMHQVLAEATILDQGKNVRLKVIVVRGTFSPEYTSAETDPQGTFRKEVHLECEIEHYSTY